MKLLQLVFTLLIFFYLGCGPSAEDKAAFENCILEEISREEAILASTMHYFDAECPGRNRKLSNFIGDTLIIEDVCGGLNAPLELKITSTSKNNTLTNLKTGRVVFSGKVCKHSDLFYFSTRINDSSYRIFTIKFSENNVYGIPTYYQFKRIDSLINTGLHNSILAKGSLFKIHSTRKNLRKLFTPLVEHLAPLQLITLQDNTIENSPIETSSESEPEDYDLISNVYPNPTKEKLTIELTNSEKHSFSVITIDGTTVLIGELNNTQTSINLNQLKAGVYTLFIQNARTQQTESVKIVKKD